MRSFFSPLCARWKSEWELEKNRKREKGEREREHVYMSPVEHMAPQNRREMLTLMLSQVRKKQQRLKRRTPEHAKKKTLKAVDRW